jgi:hypothetical protein
MEMLVNSDCLDSAAARRAASAFFSSALKASVKDLYVENVGRFATGRAALRANKHISCSWSSPGIRPLKRKEALRV